MNDVVKEWVEKAEADFGTAQREFAAGPRPNYDAVCFHAQQCIEKLMKGLFIAFGSVPPKTHDLATLGHLLGTLCPSWSWPSEDLRLLTRAEI
jgi:HEPN domain-containing protein